MSANNDYKIGRVGSGDNIRTVARSSRINALQNLARSQSDGAPYSRSGVPRSLGPGWVVNRKPTTLFRSGGGTSLRTPFQIISRIDPNLGTLQLGVIFDSHLFNTEDRDTYEYQNDTWGLLNSDEDQGWINVSLSDIGKKLWLEIELQEEDQVIVNIELRYGFPGIETAWSSFPDPIEIDVEANPPAQQFWHQIIGEISNPDIDPRQGSMTLTIPNSNGMRIQVNQLLFDNIEMTTGRTTHDADQPDIPLLVSSTPYGPATDTGGTGTPIPPDPDLMTPWQFGTVDVNNHYDFEMENASDQDGPKILIYDGVVYTANNEAFDPDGMPSDNSYIIPVEDGYEVWVGFTYENHLNYEITSCWIATGEQTPDDDPPGNTAYVTLGHVAVEYNEPESIDVVTTYNEVCGDINWQPPRFDVHFDFQLEDASDGGIAQVRIYDGTVYTANNEGVDPDGMPSNNSYVIGVEDTYEIWVGFTYENHLNYEITSCWIATGPETPDDDPTTNTAYVTLGHVDVNYSGEDNIAQVYPFNEVLGDIFWEPPRFDVHFDFQLEDASDGGTALVRIYDGVVYSANNDGVDPAGMPSGNNYVIPIQDTYEVWVGFTYENHLNYEITSCWLDAGPQTPDDDPPGNTAFVTLGHVDVNYSGTDNIAQVYAFNEVCGDVFWEPPRQNVHFDFQIEDASEGFSPMVRIYDGVILDPNDDPFDPAGMPSGNNYVIGVNDGDEIWVGVQWDMETDDGVSGDNIQSAWIGWGSDTPADEGLVQYITIGHVDVNYGPSNVQVYPFNEVCGDIVIQYPPSLDSDELLQLSVDKDTGNVVWKTSKIAQVTGEYTAFEGDSGQAWLDDIDVLTFDVTDFSVWDGGGGQAVVTLSTTNTLSVQGDSGFVDDVNHIQFTIASDPSAGYINVTDGGDGVAIVEVPVLPTTGSGTEVLGSDDGDIQWFSTDQCSD